MRITKQERAEAIERLREMVKPGDRLFTILRHVSKSGMSRVVQVVKMDEDGNPLYLGWNVAKACGFSWNDRHEGVAVGGCGFDAGFQVVYEIGRALWPEGGPLEHSARERQERQLGETIEKDGGYLLRHSWL